MSILGKVAGWSSGVNLYKYGAILVLLIASHTLVYFAGGRNERDECAQARVDAAEQHTRAVVDFSNVQGKASTVAAKRAQEIQEAVADVKQVLEAEREARVALEQCRISKSRLEALNRAARLTRHR